MKLHKEELFQITLKNNKLIDPSGIYPEGGKTLQKILKLFLAIFSWEEMWI